MTVFGMAMFVGDDEAEDARQSAYEETCAMLVQHGSCTKCAAIVSLTVRWCALCALLLLLLLLWALRWCVCIL